MSQPRGRYAGSRDIGRRQPGHVSKSSSNRQSQSYAKTPARDSAQAASIFKTRSFQFLVDAVGTENIALGLDSSMTRVAELLRGERFTPETAFHMETALGLPHGFFDQPHPVLTPEIIARLKAPLDFVEADEGADDEPESAPEIREPAAALNVGQQPSIEVRLSEEAAMPRKPAGGSPTASRKTERETGKQPSQDTSLQRTPPKSRASQKSTQQGSLPLNDDADVESVRRANLHVLTTRNGSKVRLGVVMALSGSNMAHRLHGKKRMDDVEASRFTERLGLPAGWLDTPRSEAEIPESVSSLLTPAARGRASVQRDEPPALATQKSVRSKRVAVKTRPGGPHLDGLGDAQSLTSANVQRGEGTVAARSLDQVSAASDALAGYSLDESEQRVPPASPVAPVTIEPPPASVSPERKTAPVPSTFVTSLDNLYGIEPIAEALIKTLAGKARTGRLDELKALELLQQAILL